MSSRTAYEVDVSAPLIVETYRADRSGDVGMILLRSCIVLFLGSTLAVLARATVVTASGWQLPISLVGSAITMVSPIVAILGLRRVIRNDSILLLRTDGLVYDVPGTRSFCAWDDVERIRFDSARASIVLRRRDGREVDMPTQFAGIDAAALASRMDEVRRKAIWRLLPGMRERSLR